MGSPKPPHGLEAGAIAPSTTEWYSNPSHSGKRVVKNGTDFLHHSAEMDAGYGNLGGRQFDESSHPKYYLEE